MGKSENILSDNSTRPHSNSTAGMRGFLYGYVAGNMQSGSEVIKVHIESITALLEQFIEENENAIYIHFLENAIRDIKAIRLSSDDPIKTLEYLSDAFGGITKYFEIVDTLREKKNINFFKKIMFHFLSIAQKIKSGPFVNLVTEFANRNKSLVVNA